MTLFVEVFQRSTRSGENEKERQSCGIELVGAAKDIYVTEMCGMLRRGCKMMQVVGDGLALVDWLLGFCLGHMGVRVVTIFVVFW